MNKILSVIFILILFAGFAVFDIKKKSTVKVLKVITASEIAVDKNKNNKIDSDEYFCIPDVEVFTSNLSKNQTNLQNKLNLTDIDAVKFGWLSDNFADETLTDKYVVIKPTHKKDYNCNWAEIIINGESYSKKLLTSGYGFQNGIKSPNFDNILKKAQKLDLVILNHKSNKYHKLDCSYGKAANDAIIIQKRQLSKDAKPCKYCHIENKSQKNLPKKSGSYPTIVSNGNIKLFLTDLTTKLKPDRNCTSLACKEVLQQINKSQNTIDIALYGWDNIPDVLNALKAAKMRGVKINIVYDNSKNSYYPETQDILKLADKKSGDSKETLMHNKFIIFDDKTVLTGSMNFSSTGFSGFNANTLVVINSKEAAKVYKQEFNQMLEGKFSNSKHVIKQSKIQLQNTNLTILFSPQNKAITNNIIPIINNAKDYIYIPAFVLTHSELSKALINAKMRGVDVKIIIDATGVHSTGSKIKNLREQGIKVKVENYAGKIHSKSIIVDSKYTIVGSMNFSYSGENKNDENMVIIQDEKLAQFYRGFFEYLWAKIPDKYLNRNVRAEGKDSIGSCYDGIDNNFDGKIDSQDEGCF